MWYRADIYDIFLSLKFKSGLEEVSCSSDNEEPFINVTGKLLRVRTLLSFDNDLSFLRYKSDIQAFPFSQVLFMF